MHHPWSPWLALLLVLTAGCVAPDAGEPGNETPVPTASETSSPSTTPAITASPSPTPTSSPTATPTSTPTSSPTASPEPEPGDTHTVEIGRTVKGPAADYAPDPITIQVGDQIVWENRDSIVHTATSDDDAWDTGAIGGGASSEAIVFDTPGTYTYYCAAHPGTMNGAEVIVED